MNDAQNIDMRLRNFNNINLRTLYTTFSSSVYLLFIGPSGVLALLLGIAAERNVHYIWYWSERCACAALRRCSGTKCPLFL